MKTYREKVESSVLFKWQWNTEKNAEMKVPYYDN